MARSGTNVGTVVRWNADQGTGFIESPDLPDDCWVEAAAVDPGAGGDLRAGQVVEVEWAESGDASHPVRALRVTPRDDLQATPGA
ncbi:hypothetical protein [Blastococcus brunescens]|uniref:Cold shock domain-containing protein n=1 Tax=Blastococcus brunescens TaxID=1564165 RepID=A0ABZ1AZ41_9ACTN|nr:hypothetical protein [Blastococcus sp. BMG 8361]WRL63749.1 hypothetical protein U6N30_29580 [Blastococcus sp. BMG 8361]